MVDSVCLAKVALPLAVRCDSLQCSTAGARFRVASSPKAKAAAAATGPEVVEESITTIMSGPMPLRPVTVRGRIHALFGTQERYPFCKFLGGVCAKAWTSASAGFGLL